MAEFFFFIKIGRNLYWVGFFLSTIAHLARSEKINYLFKSQ